MSAETKYKYSDKDLAIFKKLITEKINKANHDLELIKSAYLNDHNNGLKILPQHLKPLTKVVLL